MKTLVKLFVAVSLCLVPFGGLASAEFIYDIEGVFAPALSNPVSASFIGELTFPEDDVTSLTGWVELTNEPDIIREFEAELAFNLPNYRLYSGAFGEEQMTMVLLDYDNTAGMNFLASQLDEGGGWDGWGMSFADYPVGSISSMNTQAVNEPGTLALLAMGAVAMIAVVRSARRT